MSKYFGITRINDNEIKLNNKIIKKQHYHDLYTEAKNRNYDTFFNEINEYFKNKIPENVIQEIHNIARVTQICVKGSKMLYVHGFILYLALDTYIKKSKNEFINIIETGTARGFSSLCLALALYNNNQNGKIYTFENWLPNDEKIYWNCVKDFKGMHTRPELLSEWEYLLNCIQFIKRNTYPNMKIENMNRVHFAFLDAQHDYVHLNHELNEVKKLQQTGDIIICDDYTWLNKGGSQYPGIIKAIDEFKDYTKKIFYCSDGSKRRGYVYLVNDV
jgi:predicted O-methyltransferase YrrM